jgi:hypothetical protein
VTGSRQSLSGAIRSARPAGWKGVPPETLIWSRRPCTNAAARADELSAPANGIDRSTDFAAPAYQTNNVERRLKALEEQIAKLHEEIQKIRDEL